MKAIEVKDLRKYFGKTKAVDDISFEVEKGEIVGFLGPNGAGKTTTIRCMMDFLRADTGEMKILGLDSQNDSPKIKKKIGYLSSELNLYTDWTGREHLQFLRGIRNGSKYTDEYIERFNFNPTVKVKSLSTGNKQKLALILSIIHNPMVLIMDEPTTGLDPLLQDTIYDILKQKAKEGVSIFMSSHNLSEVERVCDRVLILKQGKIVDRESIAELKQKRLYTVYVYFDEKVSEKEIKSKDIEIRKNFGDGYMLNVKGDIKPLLAKLREFRIKDIEIKHSNLEDIFLEFYK